MALLLPEKEDVVGLMEFVRQTIKIAGINGIALTKLDVLDELDEIKICVQYELNGKKIDYFPSSSEDQFNVKPIYKTFPGWKSSTQGVRNMKDLPEKAKTIFMR